MGERSLASGLNASCTVGVGKAQDALGSAQPFDDPVAEEARLNAAVAQLQAQIDEMLEGHKAVLGPSYELLETYKMLAYSRSWNHSLTEAVKSGVTAEVAVSLALLISRAISSLLSIID